MKTIKILTALFALIGTVLSANSKDVTLNTNYGDINLSLDE